ncbi:hypothetical protein LPTSP3_g34280 [Leptospira kobayashii]|uniref:Lipoprotein n=1 Tax=Leptospira kobayashii TaxID=1917830 RepID=A0ABN6KGX6_9LEPT|nr:hypothetical protein [Leptospira kobayashii]BDA80498.1 hypothetical protein LPTSP3_g34280 [Leptospira kobayashii]
MIFFRFIFIIYLLPFLLTISCKSEHENLVADIDDLIAREKYEKALSLLEERLSANRNSAEVLSKSKPNQPRLFQVSEDRTKIVWTENKTVFYRDLILDKSEERELKIRPDNFKISANGDYAVMQFPLKQKGGCAIFAYSLTNSSLEYESGAHVPCKTGMGITSDGSKIYYFFENDLFEEKTSLPKNPKKYISGDEFPTTFPKLKANYQLASLGDDWLLWSGTGGSYNLYYINSFHKRISLFTKDIVLPRILYHNGTTAYLVGGKVGDLFLKEVNYLGNKSPSISRGTPINAREAISYRLTAKDEFISPNQSEPLQPMKWKVLGKKEHLPFFLERFWGVSGDRIVYENKKGELVIDNLQFTKEDWSMWNYYKEVKKKNDG